MYLFIQIYEIFYFFICFNNCKNKDFIDNHRLVDLI